MIAPSTVMLDDRSEQGVRAWMRGVQADVAADYLIVCVRHEIAPERAQDGLRLVLGAEEPPLIAVCAAMDLLEEAVAAEDDPDGYYWRCNDAPCSPDGRAEWSIERAYELRLECWPLILGWVR